MDGSRHLGNEDTRSERDDKALRDAALAREIADYIAASDRFANEHGSLAEEFPAL